MRGVTRGAAVVMVVAGAATMILGSRAIAGAGAPDPSVESELRFYGAWYLGTGLFLWSLAPRLAERRTEFRAVWALLFAAGLARLGAWLDAGRPHWTALVLLALELTLPPLIVLWHARVTSSVADPSA